LSGDKYIINLEKTTNISEFLEQNKLSIFPIPENISKDEEECHNIRKLNDLFQSLKKSKTQIK
jgi:hypothetical protein